MRQKLTLALAGVAAAAAFAPLTSAHAVCHEAYYAATGYCSPCHHLRDLIGQPQTCLE